MQDNLLDAAREGEGQALSEPCWQPTAPHIDRDPMSPRKNCFREGDRQQDVNRRWAETSFDMQHLPDFER